MKYNGFLKRSFDIVASTTLLAATLPVTLPILAVSAAYLKANPIYLAPRKGLNKKIFNMIKIKTLTPELDENGLKLTEEERQTPLGKFLRYTAIDEWFQLINVAKGDMSFVGPRPNTFRIPLTKDQEDTLYSVRPGITGPWQVAVIGTTERMSESDRLEHELSYIQDGISFKKDMGLIARTPITMFLGHDGMRTPKV